MLPVPSNQDPRIVQEQLALLREVTRTTGLLHSAQTLQLDYWVRIVLDICPEPEIMWGGLESFRTLLVCADSDGTDRTVEEWRKRIEHLNGWVRWLLGDDVLLRVRVDDQVVWG